jgi:hypothetical protein
MCRGSQATLGATPIRFRWISFKAGDVFSNPQSHLPDHLQPFRDYLYLHYRVTKSFASGDEIWERVDE